MKIQRIQTKKGPARLQLLRYEYRRSSEGKAGRTVPVYLGTIDERATSVDFSKFKVQPNEKEIDQINELLSRWRYETDLNAWDTKIRSFPATASGIVHGIEAGVPYDAEKIYAAIDRIIKALRKAGHTHSKKQKAPALPKQSDLLAGGRNESI